MCMMELDRNALEQQKVDLKLALKTWEAQFIAENGRKAGRDDIKANPPMALKYNEYHRTRDILSGKVTSSKQSPKKLKRERPETDLPESPSKRRKSPRATPQKRAYLAPPVPRDEREEDQQHLQTPAVKRTFLGPTPQRDGIILGIFDSPPVAGTPSRNRTILCERDANVAVTPSKPVDKIQESPAQYEERARGSRTPASTGKRFMLDAFMTPSHNRRRAAEDDDQHLQATPSSTLKTPTFLRRDNFVMGTIAEEPSSPRGVQPWKRRAFGRSLSGMIQDMRREQERQADEELDLLREMEDEADGVGVPKVTKASGPPKIVVQESQVVSGLDRDGFVPSDVDQSASEEEQEQQLGRGGKPRKPWKKKGLKRQTRRVNMRPVAKKAQAHPTEPQEAEEDDDEVVQDTQQTGDVPSGFEEGSDDEYGDDAAAKQKPIARVGAAKKKPAGKDKADVEKKKTTKAKRKVKPDAHANYRALKIKNKNSKGKGNGRFGRRR